MQMLLCDGEAARRGPAVSDVMIVKEELGKVGLKGACVSTAYMYGIYYCSPSLFIPPPPD